MAAIGKYTKYMSNGINLPECGLRYPVTVHNYTFKSKCYVNKYRPKAVYDFDGNNLLTLDEPKQRVFGGTETAKGEAPWTVLITLEPPWVPYGLGYCTGSLITFEWVLTAAHCVQNWYDLRD